MDAPSSASLSSRKAVRSEIWATGEIDAKIPDGCCDQVFAGFEQRREIKAFIAPVGQIAARWTIANPLAVDEKNEAIVCADTDDVLPGNLGQCHCAAKMEHQLLMQRGRRMGDPLRLPIPVGRIGLCGLLADQYH